MVDQDSVQDRKDAAAEGASENSGIGLDGDGPSVADADGGSGSTDGAGPAVEHPDPVTGRRTNATGVDQAAENEEREPAG